jgi:8-hydroxy-5-deazaflavin:NADPH oxidoreductase
VAKIGILGGGSVGQALAHLFIAAGHDVVVGTRTGQVAPEGARPGDMQASAAHGEVVVIAVPFTAAASALAPLAAMLAGKVLVDATNPLGDDWGPLSLGENNSAAEDVQRLLPQARVVKAFNTVFADVMRPDRLNRPGGRVAAFIAADDAAAADAVAKLAESAGFDPVRTGPLANARYLEALAHLNIAIAVGQGGGTDAAFLYSR